MSLLMQEYACQAIGPIRVTSLRGAFNSLCSSQYGQTKLPLDRLEHLFYYGQWRNA